MDTDILAEREFRFLRTVISWLLHQGAHPHFVAWHGWSHPDGYFTRVLLTGKASLEGGVISTAYFGMFSVTASGGHALQYYAYASVC